MVRGIRVLAKHVVAVRMKGKNIWFGSCRDGIKGGVIGCGQRYEGYQQRVIS